MKSPPQTTSERPVHQQIFEGLRAGIVEGRFPAGSFLPSTRSLAATWKASLFTINTALKALAREGWVKLRHGARTFVVDPNHRFLCAGIYHGDDIAAVGRPAFGLHLHVALVQQLERLKKETQVFMDLRPLKEQHRILPSLANAIRQRRIQCLFAPSTNHANLRFLSRLTIPMAFLSNPASPTHVNYDRGDMCRQSAGHLAKLGCRSAGVLATILPGETAAAPSPTSSDFFFQFTAAMHERGLTTHPSWLQHPDSNLHVSQFEKFGYERFKAFWRLPKKPDALIVFPDTAAIGVILAIAEIGFQTVARRMKFIFHRNAHATIFCPMPVTWAISDETALAGALLQQIQRQFAGKAISPIILPYVLRPSE